LKEKETFESTEAKVPKLEQFTCCRSKELVFVLRSLKILQSKATEESEEIIKQLNSKLAHDLPCFCLVLKSAISHESIITHHPLNEHDPFPCF